MTIKDNNPTPTGDPAGEEVTPVSLPREHPAETVTFVAAVVALLAGLGFDVSTTVLFAAIAVVGLAPTMITWVVNLYRDAARDLGG